ncbi:hypothetical protein [Streptomyces sp. DG1A-41]|uniref:hypothetical protein n=1 Tax=Streptomyces sp. DG1A-41 TaxID=3125779 RepID=UPI0030D3F8B4
MYLYKGTGKTGSEALSSRIVVRSAWTGYNAFDAVGDVSGDGNAEFLARTSGGTLYLYRGTGKATSEIFAPRSRSAPVSSSTTSGAETAGERGSPPPGEPVPRDDSRRWRTMESDGGRVPARGTRSARAGGPVRPGVG